jgi:FkbM family methyltransferase
MSRSVSGSAGDYYFGAIEFEEMALTLHYLQPTDVFGDVGANIGSWTIAAAGVCGARVITLEPLPATHAVLLDNIAINRINHLVRPLAIGAGSKAEKLHLSVGSGVENHIVYDKSGTEIELLPLDDIFVEAPTALKIDVEGFEAAVISGAGRIINDYTLKIIIVEDVGLSGLHGFDRILFIKIW